MDEQPLAPSGTGRIYARCLSLKLKSTHNDIRAWSGRGLPGLIKLEPPRRILNLLSYVYHQFDPLGGRDESLRKICVTPTQRDIKVCYVPCPRVRESNSFTSLEKKGSRKDPRLLTGLCLPSLQGFLYRSVKTEVKKQEGRNFQ